MLIGVDCGWGYFFKSYPNVPSPVLGTVGGPGGGTFEGYSGFQVLVTFGDKVGTKWGVYS